MRLLFFFLLLALGCDRSESKTVIRFLEGPDNGGGWKEIVERFEKAHPDIDVELVEGPAATDTRENMYSTEFLSGSSSYDVVYMDVIWVPKFASQGWLRPLDDLFPADERQQFLPGDIRGSIHDGKIYRVPMRSDAGLLYYRSDTVERPPETFDELTEAARKSRRPGELWGFVFQGRQYEGLVCAFLEVLWGFGGDVFDDRGAVVLDRPEAVRALEWMRGLIPDISPEGVTTYQEEECRNTFQEGRAIFMRNWPYAWTKMQEANSPVRGKVGIVPMVHAPGRKSAATLGGWGFGISATARNPDAAWKFIRFATEPDQQKILNLKNGAIPTRRSLFRDEEILKKSPHYPDLYRILLEARPRPVHPKYPQISDAIQVHVSAALVGKERPAEALRRAAGKIREIIGK